MNKIIKNISYVLLFIILFIFTFILLNEIAKDFNTLVYSEADIFCQKNGYLESTGGLAEQGCIKIINNKTIVERIDSVNGTYYFREEVKEGG